jgi:ketosteroid isomerase-like protein
MLTLVAIISMAVPLAAAWGAGDDRGGDAMATATKESVARLVKLWNENKLEEMVADHYTDDAILVAPNHEPIHGKAAILEYLKGARASAGEFDSGYDVTLRSSGDLLSLFGQYSFRSGKLRINTHELFERQPDGSVRSSIDMFGFRDPVN